MNKLRCFLTALFAFGFLLNLEAQNNNSSDNRSNNNRGSRRFTRRCTEPFSMRSFNRDYSGLASTNNYHLDHELRDYSKERCLSAEQIRRLAILFPTDREKYEFLTFAFNHVFDIENFAMTGTVLANRNAKDAFYRFLVREGVPAGDYFFDPYYAQSGGYCYNGIQQVPPQYRDQRMNNPYDNPYNNSNNPNYNRNQNSQNYSDNNNGKNPYDNFEPQNNGQNGQNPNGNLNTQNPNNGQGNINAGYRGMMTYKEFEILKEKIKQNTFEKGKIETAKNLTRENVLTANQIAEITRIFSYDTNRLDYAKFAYDYAADKENYNVVNETLAFEVNKKDLQRYVDSRKRG